MTHELNLNRDLISVNQWLCANKLSLNIDKSNFVIFRPPQKKVNYNIKLKIDNKDIKEMKSIKYLGVYIDCHLKWKEHILEVSKKLARGIGILLKLRHFVNLASLVQVYYFITYSFLTYGIIVWGNTYSSNLQPLIILQKKAIRIITFSDFRTHTSPIFKQLSLLSYAMLLSFKLHYSCISITRVFSQIYLLIFLHLLGVNINTKHA